MENNSTWQRLYELAAQLYNLRPWDYLIESDVFGVEIPVTGKQYFISIMGSEGILKSLAAYEGSVALADFWAIENSETAEGSELLSIPHVILSFENEEDIDAGQLKRFRNLSNNPVFKDIFPEVRHVIPGRYPDEPGEAVLNEMIIVLEQSLDVVYRATDDPDIIYPDENDDQIYLFRKQDADEWQDQYLKIDPPSVHYQFKWNSNDIDEITALPLTNVVMQAHSQLLPLQVIENDILYFSYIVILVNKKSGRVEKLEMMIADPDFHSMLEKVPDRYLHFIKELGIRPRAIEVKNDLLFEMLSEPMRLCGIKLNKYKELPAVSEAINGIIEYSNRQQ